MRWLRRQHSALILLALAAAAAGLWFAARRQATRVPAERSPRRLSYEARARQQFFIDHPGEKPLNWSIGRVALQFHRSQPMGKFVLGVTPGRWGNDCSDYVACIVDEGLGAGARFNRGSKTHIYEKSDVMQAIYWTPGTVVQPGDIVSVRHSPWYEPQENSCGHVGIVGSDGMVYDFSKLRRWKQARYSRTPFEWFVRHSPGEREVVIRRLRPQYRYRIEPLPHECGKGQAPGERGVDSGGL